MVRRGERCQEIVDEGEPKGHALERCAKDVDRRGGERQPRDGAPSARAPARAALAREEREHREPVLGVRVGDQRPLDRVRLAEVERAGAPRVHVAALGQGPARDGAARVEPVAPQPPRRRHPGRIGHDPHRRRRADIDGHPRAIGAARAHTARGAIADGGIPDRAPELRPPARPGLAEGQALIEVREREEAPLVEARRVEHLGIPVLTLLIEEAGRRGHRDAGDGPAQPLGGEAARRWSPTAPGGPWTGPPRAIGAWPASRTCAAGSRCAPARPPRRAAGRAPRPRPRSVVSEYMYSGVDGPPRPVEAEETVPERRDARRPRRRGPAGSTASMHDAAASSRRCASCSTPPSAVTRVWYSTCRAPPRTAAPASS